MDEVVASFHRSIPRMLGWIAAGAMLTAVAAVVVHGIPNTAPPTWMEKIAGWVGLFLFGLTTLMMLVRLFRSAPVVEVSAGGIRCGRGSQAFVPWTAVADFSVRTVRQQYFLTFRLRPDPGHEIAGAQTRTITLSGLEGNVEHLVAAIRAARSRVAMAERGSNPS
jgi:hypothetical protein